MIPAWMIPNMTTITFAGLTIYAYNQADISYDVQVSETVALTGDLVVALSSKTRAFPRSFDCYTEDYTDISSIAAKIGVFDTLTVGSVSFSDCYISGFEGIKEAIKNSGKWKFSLKFGKADVH